MPSPRRGGHFLEQWAVVSQHLVILRGVGSIDSAESDILIRHRQIIDPAGPDLLIRLRVLRARPILQWAQGVPSIATPAGGGRDGQPLKPVVFPHISTPFQHTRLFSNEGGRDCQYFDR